MKKFLIIGARGQLGNDLVKIFKSSTNWDIEDLDICNFEKTRKMIERVEPEIIINTAAYHNVEECETNPQEAFRVNTIAITNLAKICSDINAILVHFSTDYVFDGRNGSPYNEDDLPNPINFYGLSKFAGEISVANTCSKYYIFRLASLFGIAGARGKGGNFVEAMIKKAKNNEEIKVVDDITMSPTYTKDTAHFLSHFLNGHYPFGIYHLTNSGFCSWFQFALEIFKKVGVNVKIEAVSYTDMDLNVKRPKYSALISNRLPKLGLQPLKSWQDALDDYLKEKTHI